MFSKFINLGSLNSESASELVSDIVKVKTPRNSRKQHIYASKVLKLTVEGAKHVEQQMITHTISFDLPAGNYIVHAFNVEYNVQLKTEADSKIMITGRALLAKHNFSEIFKMELNHRKMFDVAERVNLVTVNKQLDVLRRVEVTVVGIENTSLTIQFNAKYDNVFDKKIQYCSSNNNNNNTGSLVKQALHHPIADLHNIDDSQYFEYELSEGVYEIHIVHMSNKDNYCVAGHGSTSSNISMMTPCSGGLSSALTGTSNWNSESIWVQAEITNVVQWQLQHVSKLHDTFI